MKRAKTKTASIGLNLLPGKRIIAGVRFYEPYRRTSARVIKPVERELIEVK